MLAKYLSIIRNTLLDAFRTNSRNFIGRNISMVILLLANQDLMPMLLYTGYLLPIVSECQINRRCEDHLSLF